MIETGVVLNLRGEPIHWHLPNGRTMASLPDSVDLWNVFWDNRHDISGFAHSHPGFGRTAPSWTDITTFEGVEAGLGKRLDWWITSGDSMILVRWTGPEKLDYSVLDVTIEPNWVIELRKLSTYR